MRATKRTQLLAVILLGTLAMSVGGAVAPGLASAQELMVSGLGQPGAISSSPQPAVQPIDRGPCDTPYDVAQANGAPSSCAWPATGSTGWDPALEIAGGDTLELRFASAASTVTVTSTVNEDPRVTAPDGRSIPNELWFGPVSATATTEPGIWTVALPAQPPGRFYGARGGTFAVLATTDGQSRAYSMRLKTPRADVFNGPCGGRYFTSPGVSGTSPCPVPAGGKTFLPGPPSPGPPPTPPTVSKLKLSVGPARRVQGGVRMTVNATRGGALLIRGQLGRRTYTARRTIHAGATAVTLSLASRSHGQLKLRVQLKAGAAQATATRTKHLP